MNYIITSTFIGCVIDLLRLADLVYYLYIIATAKSTVERRVIRHVRRVISIYISLALTSYLQKTI